jgi:hypothetical protein
MNPATSPSSTDNPSGLPGWGIDADPQNDPTYPLKYRTDDERKGYNNYDRPPQQEPTQEVLHSIERPTLPAVLGNSVPPQGLSGMIRRVAFRYSENHYGHWLPLLLADRVGVVEGIVNDLAHGHVPNIWAEKGYPAHWKHDAKGLALRLATTAAIAGGLLLLLTSGGDKRKERIRSGARR